MGSISEFIPSSYDGEDARIYLSAVQQLQNEIKSISKELITVGGNIKSSANIIKSTEDVDLNR